MLKDFRQGRPEGRPCGVWADGLAVPHGRAGKPNCRWHHCQMTLRVLSMTSSPEEGNDLGAGTALLGAECRVRSSGGDVVLRGPEHGRCVPGVAGHVGERHFRLRRNGAAGRAPEEGHCLRTGTSSVGTERSLRDASGDPVLHGPAHRVVVIRRLRHIGEGQLFNRRDRASERRSCRRYRW